MQNHAHKDVSNLDYEGIKSNLISFLRAQPEFKDFDYNGSAISSLMSLLSYVTHINAINANIGLNETFLETAKFRGSVAGHARTLGYIPRSAKSAMAVVDVNVPNSRGKNVILKRGHTFAASTQRRSFNFVTTEDYSSNGTGVISNVRLYQGSFHYIEYIFDVNSNEKLVIPNPNIDTTHLRVTVLRSDKERNHGTIYHQAKVITSIKNNSNVYFLYENPDGLYEITFGDNILGNRPENGNIIHIEYLVTNLKDANGADKFNAGSNIDGYDKFIVITRQPARGGDEKESIDSIKRNAPLTFAAQNRVVIPADYEAVIRENFSNVHSVSVWGGEDNDPPIYGKVFVSISPKTGLILSSEEKENIQNDILKSRKIMTIEVDLVDPEILYVIPEVHFSYDSSITTLSKVELESIVHNRIHEWNKNHLNRFNAIFRHSKFLQYIDQSNSAILNSRCKIHLLKTFVPRLNVSFDYTINFSNTIFQIQNNDKVVIKKSTLFTYNGQINCKLKDLFFDETDNTRIVSIVKDDNDESIVVHNVGKIYKDKIILRKFAPNAIIGGSIGIYIDPISTDVYTSKNNILLLSPFSNRYVVVGKPE
jgi:hypothetical protein